MHLRNDAKHLPRLRLRGDDRRRHCVSVRLSPRELRHIRQLATGGARKSLGQTVREIALGAVPVYVPEPNHERWAELARALANVNQLAYHLNCGRIPEDVRPLLAEVFAAVVALRAELRGEKI